MQHLLPDYVSIPRFAQLKNVSSKRVRAAVSREEITPCLVGMDKTIMINYRQYRKYRFADRSKDRSAKTRRNAFVTAVVRGARQ